MGDTVVGTEQRGSAGGRSPWRVAVPVVVVLAVIAAVLVVVKPFDTGGGTKVRLLGWTTLDQPLAGADVRVESLTGELITKANAATDRGGTFDLPPRRLPADFRVVVEGGHRGSQVSADRLVADVHAYGAKDRRPVVVNALTTILARYQAAHKKASAAQALTQLRKTLELSSEVPITLDPASLDPEFSHARFLAEAQAGRGFDDEVASVAAAMATGAPRSFAGAPHNPLLSPANAQLLSSLGSAVGVISGGLSIAGSIMSFAGVDAQTQALNEVKEQLVQINQQLTQLQTQLTGVHSDVLRGAFGSQLSTLPITTLRDLDGYLIQFINASPETRPQIRQLFLNLVAGNDKVTPRIEPAINLRVVLDTFNDRLNPVAGDNIIAPFAKERAVDKLFTAQEADDVQALIALLDHLQVVTLNSYVELRNIQNQRADARDVVQKVITRREEQFARLPKPLPVRETIDLRTNFGWLDAPICTPFQVGSCVQRGGSWSAVNAAAQQQSPGSLSGWRLPDLSELNALVQQRGGKTVKRYLIEDGGLGNALLDVPEFSYANGFLWTSTVFSQRSSVIEGPIAIVAQHQTVSTNDAAVRPWPDGTGGYGIALRPVPPGELKASYPY